MLVVSPRPRRPIAAEVGKGYKIRKIELVLPFRAEEYQTESYDMPSGMSFLGSMWINDPPRWHAVAWALRKPWCADAGLGPTYNASINGAVYWKHFGAQDTTADRYPEQLGPSEISHIQTVGRMDITALLNDAAYGKTLAARLRQFADCGVLLRKWETYDARYLYSGYEWGTPTGGRGIIIHTPKLEVTSAGQDAGARQAARARRVAKLAAGKTARPPR